MEEKTPLAGDVSPGVHPIQGDSVRCTTFLRTVQYIWQSAPEKAFRARRSPPPAQATLKKAHAGSGYSHSKA